MASTPPPPYGYVQPDRARAASQVAPPAIALMVLGGLGLLADLGGLLVHVLGASVGAFAPRLGDERIVRVFSGGVGIAFALFGIVLYGLMVLGALKMKALEGYALAMTAAIIAMLPCSCCCFVGVPIGIWALVVLLDANVKAAFRS